MAQLKITLYTKGRTSIIISKTNTTLIGLYNNEINIIINKIYKIVNISKTL